jgi:mRNA interferase MazF
MSKPYDVILVPFPLTNLMSQKIRPALQLSNITDSDVIFCAISTKKHSIFDITVSPTKENGLKQVSYVRTNKIATIDKQLVLARLGTLETKATESVQVKLLKIFGL